MQFQKLKLALLIGGPSPEHDVSLATGALISKNIDRARYEVCEVVIPRNGGWEMPQDIDVAFIAIHGAYGEDGTIQSLLEVKRIPYTGSGVAASMLAMDKVKSVDIFARCGLTIAAHISVSKDNWRANPKDVEKQAQNLGYPCVVKPTTCGSSVGITILKDDSQLKRSLEQAFSYAPAVLVEKYITGREFTCGVLDEGDAVKPVALPPTEIVPKHASFFDYDAKYTPGATDEITPPDLPGDMVKKIQATALQAHRIIGCSGISRTDMILSDKKLYVLEINTIPGMTETSLYPQAAAVAGISFPLLLDKLINAALQKSGSIVPTNS